MIIGGNLLVGRYAEEFLPASGIDTREVLSGALPWLGSTQGFVRAISQLFIYKLIPLIEPTIKDSNLKIANWYLERVWLFLENNSDMVRLRKKQELFFYSYDAESACDVTDLLQMSVDEGMEACPKYLVEEIKRCLKESYQEAHEHELPTWKQADELLQHQKHELDMQALKSIEDADEANFQRKIMPLDALNLTLEDCNNAKFRNAAGRTKQDIIVCASLIDKVPNLAGLARTAEIFACSKLIVPDAGIQKMDNLKKISVGADEWIDIEECKEEVS